MKVLRATRQLLEDMAAHPAGSNMRSDLHALHDTAEQVLSLSQEFQDAAVTVGLLRLGMGKPRAATSPGGAATPPTPATRNP